MSVRVAVLTVSDRVSRGESVDKSGPALVDICQSKGWTITHTATVADSVHAIQSVLRAWCDAEPSQADLILTTGGTGFGVRDLTPEAVSPMLHRMAPGITTAMLASSLTITPMAALSRPVAGVRFNTIIITLPGSTKGAVENLTAVLSVIPHAVELARGGNKAGEETHEAMARAASSGHSKSAKGGHVCHHKSDVSLDPAAEISAFGLSGNLKAPVHSRNRKSPYPLVDFDQALDLVLNHAEPLRPRVVSVSEKLVSHVLAEAVTARDPVPGYRASVVDGYAVIVSDGPGVYPVANVQNAGGAAANQAHPELKSKTIGRVTTGAMIPVGTEAVIMVEDTELASSDSASGEELLVKILVQAKMGENIREVGCDAAVGEVVLEKGCVIGAAGGEVGILASVGVTDVLVNPHPTVAIVSSGNELVHFSTPSPLQPPFVRDTNYPSLSTAIQDSMPGCKIVNFESPAQDTEESLYELLNRALGSDADVLISTGGVSMGEADMMKSVLEQRLGAKIWFGRVLMKPGKPSTFATVEKTRLDGTIHKKLVFALPGNPVSALVGFYLFALPALRKLAGFERPSLPKVFAKLAHDIHLDSRPEFYRVRVVTTSDHNTKQTLFVAHGTGSQMSSRMLSMRGANALLKLPPANEAKGVLLEGEMVEAWLIGEL
ncbi:MoaB/Mog domain-containing protein [Chytriomyces cf. hyalinus JEL632]|nr:MoaB/Mog domain-containing protein [Chytriomyces cf. hyalinus JEL632]